MARTTQIARARAARLSSSSESSSPPSPDRPRTRSPEPYTYPPPPPPVTRTQRPGFGLPLNWRPGDYYRSRHRPFFPNAVSLWSAKETTVREKSMLAVMNLLTDKDEWRRKVFDENIVERWRKEAVTTEGQGFSDEMFDFCIAELRDKAQRYENFGMVAVLDGAAGVVKSDSIIPTQLKEALKAAVKPLEDVPEKDRDWHPGSSGQVLDLVHPSLFPLMYGRSKIIPEGELDLADALSFTGATETMPSPSEEETREDMSSTGKYLPLSLWSRKYQWLPAEVRFSGDSHVKLTSYINNLHPIHHKELYSVLEDLIAKVIPAWSLTLGILNRKLLKEQDLRIPCPNGAEYENEDEDEDEDDDDDDDDDDDQDDETYTSWDEYVRRRDARRTLIPPQPRPYRTKPPPSFDLRTSFAAQGLQVIVKLATIHLTPDNPHYAGGAWHVEGCLNERICATALYYYDSANIADDNDGPLLAFRQRIGTWDLYMHKTHGQGDYSGVEHLYGIASDGAAVQAVGAVRTREGRLVCFPNVFQHRVRPFGLRDRDRPGHRKLVALFLVDPYQRVLSTANVPPQQREWYEGEGEGEGRVSLEEAREVRLDLMEERRAYQEGVQQSMDETTFNFCEH